jgi:putative addiction module CopG family antidote
MQVHLPAELEAFVQELVDKGAYLTPGEVLVHALWLLKDYVDLNQHKLAELKKLIAVGIEQVERGEAAPLDMEAIKAKAAARLQQEQAQEAGECPR